MSVSYRIFIEFVFTPIVPDLFLLLLSKIVIYRGVFRERFWGSKPIFSDFFQFARFFKEKNPKTPFTPKFSRPYKKISKPSLEKFLYTPLVIQVQTFQRATH